MGLLVETTSLTRVVVGDGIRNLLLCRVMEVMQERVVSITTPKSTRVGLHNHKSGQFKCKSIFRNSQIHSDDVSKNMLLLATLRFHDVWRSETAPSNSVSPTAMLRIIPMSSPQQPRHHSLRNEVPATLKLFFAFRIPCAVFCGPKHLEPSFSCSAPHIA